MSKRLSSMLITEAEDLLGPFRERYDPAAAAGMPSHITLLYPFRPLHEVDDSVVGELDRCFADFPAFTFSLSRIGHFRGHVLYLSPDPEEPFRRLTSAIWRCFPQTPPYGGRHREIVPHLTVADLAEKGEIDEARKALARATMGKLPIHAVGKEISLMDLGTGRWQVHRRFVLSRA